MIFRNSKDYRRIGKVLFEIPNSSNYSKTAFAPVLPIITKTYILPKNSTVSNVSLENQVYTLLTEQVELGHLPTTKTHGAIDGEL